MTKSNHRCNVVRINELLAHPNADSLSLVQIGGYQVVVKTENWKVGDLGVYVQPDSVVPQTSPFDFLWADKVFPDGVVPEKHRRVTVRRFRKEWSEGLLLPFRDFAIAITDNTFVGPLMSVKEGDDVAEILGITHYDPPEPEEKTVTRKQQYKWPPKSFRGWVYYLLHLIGIDLNGNVGGTNSKGPKNPPPVYDVEAFKNFRHAFEPGEQVVVTEKIHGSNARFLFDGKTFFVGSRKLWKSERSSCVWRQAVAQNPWIEEWCRANPGYTLYGEVAPTQGDKFKYCTENGQVKFFAFDILGPSGYLDAINSAGKKIYELPLTWVPLLYSGPFDEGKIKELVDGQSTVPGAKNIREGVVVRPVVERHVTGLGRLQLKLVSNAFLNQDSK